YTQRTALSETMRLFFGDHDVLLLPTSQVPPFPVEQEFPATINGVEMPDYLAWMRWAYFITVTGCPAISLPAGRTSAGLPVGVQLVARHGADRQLLEVAAAVEALHA
ncbi:MAG TPA: amidase family protein, partial [Nocardioides sp.]|nr:amidase family protein [Nocardioides sp.]